MAGVIYARNRFAGYGAPGDAAKSMVFSLTPKPGFFYQSKKGDTPWSIANRAYAKPGFATVKTGLFLINDSQWNNHIRKSTKNWESYGIKGFQITPDYDPSDVQSTHGSGKSHPIVWIPDLDGKEPNEETPAPQPIKGDTGATGSQGPKGDPGRPPTAQEIAAAVASYLAKNPINVPGVNMDAVKGLISDFLESNPPEVGTPGPKGRPPTAAEIQKAVAAELQKNPPPAGARGPRGLPGDMPPEMVSSLIQEYLQKNPIQAIKGDTGDPGPAGRPPTPEEIQAAVNTYMEKHAPSGGGVGPRGATGAPGRPPSPTEIRTAVDSYMEANPIKQGGGLELTPEFLEQAKGLIDSRIRTYARNELPKYIDQAKGEATKGSVGMILLAGIIGGGITAAAMKKSRKRSNRKLLGSGGSTWLR